MGESLEIFRNDTTLMAVDVGRIGMAILQFCSAKGSKISLATPHGTNFHSFVGRRVRVRMVMDVLDDGPDAATTPEPEGSWLTRPSLL